MTDWLDASTLGLLFGMMLIVGQLKRTGLFEVLCAATLRLCGGRMWLLVVLVLYLTGGFWGGTFGGGSGDCLVGWRVRGLPSRLAKPHPTHTHPSRHTHTSLALPPSPLPGTAFVSAFLDNVTTMLLMGPISIAVMRTCGRSPAPLLIAQALMSNVGGTATMVGDPPNIIIGNALARHIGFADFLAHLAPGGRRAAGGPGRRGGGKGGDACNAGGLHAGQGVASRAHTTHARSHARTHQASSSRPSR